MVARLSFSCCESKSLSLMVALAWRYNCGFSCFLGTEGEGVDFALVGANMLLSEVRLLTTFGWLSKLIIDADSLLKSEAPGALAFRRYLMTTETKRWLSCINLPSCLRSSPWYRRLNPQRVSISFLFRQNEKDMLLSSRSCTIWMICLLESARERTDGEDLVPRVEPTAGR